MVTRKAVPEPVPRVSTTPQSPSAPNPPYPSSPPLTSAAPTIASSNSDSVYSPDLKTSPAFDLVELREAQQRARSNSDSSHDTWNSDGTEKEDEAEEEVVAVPEPLKVRSSQQNMNGQVVAEQREELPPSLRIGPAKPVVSPSTHGYEDEAQANPWSSEAAVRSPSNTKNPYLKQNGYFPDNSQAAWQASTPPPLPENVAPTPPTNAPPPPPAAPIELPAMKSPTQELEEMSFGQNRTASWETAERFSVPPLGQSPLSHPVPVRSPPPSDAMSAVSAVSAKDESRPVSTWWQDSEAGDHEQNESAFAAPPHPPPPQQYQPPPGPPPGKSGNLIDHEDAPSSSTRPAPSAPTASLQTQRNTTYQIKHVNWLDETSTLTNSNSKSKSTLRNSPILTQNANGPCPLLALVNALILSTPLDVSTSLSQILSDREQISLGLLLDAVFDELMSERRAGASGQLPDVTDLYAFLLALHTGMNVNPRFVTPATTPRGSWDGVPKDMSGLHPMHKAQFKAGAFEETREMKLYSTFGIPLIHGWTPEPNSPAYDAFARSAQTFEDAQNIQFVEMELEEKNASGNLTPQERKTLDDVKTIKSFLDTWPTQLTEFGLETMSKSLLPGQIAILFRNDHFSTIYKEPRNGALMTLVTDTGYATHDEIVWESLVDVNGAASEMFSGDFRVVSHGQDVRIGSPSSKFDRGEDAWLNAQQEKSSAGASSSPPPPPLPGPRPSQAPPFRDEDLAIQMTEAQRKAAEQEDHDLALALQLQEEEEDRQRQDEQRRKREQELSEQFLSNENEGPRPPIPPRRSGGRTTSSTSNTTGIHSRNSSTTIPVTSPATRDPVNRPSDDANDPDAPPSYEQAASDRPYRPAGSTASGTMAQGNPLGAYDALRRQSAYAQQGLPSGTNVNTGLPTFAEAGPSSPPYSFSASSPNAQAIAAARRRSDAARVRRGNQIGFSVPPQRTANQPGGVAPGHYPGSWQARSSERLNAWNRANVPAGAAAGSAGAPGVKEAEEKEVMWHGQRVEPHSSRRKQGLYRPCCAMQ